MTLIPLLTRAMLMVLLLVAPVFALPATQPMPIHIIEAPEPQSTGLGFVLTVILQKR